MDEKRKRRQSKLEEFNSLSTTSSAQARGLAGGSPGGSALQDPKSAESPLLSPSSRNASTVSINNMTGPSSRSRATTLDVPGLTRSKVSPNGEISARDVGSKLVIVMVGLPARGKSYVTKKLCRFLNWQQHNCRIFNVGNTRRRANQYAGPSDRPLPDYPDGQQAGREAPNVEPPADETSHSADFFSPENQKSFEMREQWAYDTLNELLDYVLEGEGSVGILDATNTTVARRKAVMNRIRERSNNQLKVLFLESICSRSEIIENNVHLKLSGPDYRNMDKAKALRDFLNRLHNYEKVYETIGPQEEKDPDFQYIKMINVGQKLECGNIKGFLAGQTVFFLLNFNLNMRQIWITRHGESTDNEKGQIGGDAPLTERGDRYSKALAKFMEYKKKEFRRQQLAEYTKLVRLVEQSGSEPPTPMNEPESVNFCVWTSMLQRAVDTAKYFDENEFDLKEMRMLNEIDAGVCDGMTYEEIREKLPDEYKARMADKTRYRYPGVGGESYLDVINRLRAVIVEIERMSENLLVICHRVVARILLAYFMNLGRDAIGDLEVPLHTLYVLEPKPYGVEWELYKYNERSNWFYHVPKEANTIKNQLTDKSRRYTVVATADMVLGDTLERNKCTIYDDTVIEEASDEDESEGQAISSQSRHTRNSSESDPDCKNDDIEAIRAKLQKAL